MRVVIMAGIIAAMLGGIGMAQTPSSDDLRRAALDNLWPLPSPSALFPESEAALDSYQRWVDEKRSWTTTIEDRRVRAAYDGWLDHVERCIMENREENRTHARAKQSEVFWEKHQAESRRASALATTLPKPPR